MMDFSFTALGSGFAGTAIGIALPFLFNSFVLPRISAKARLQKYLRIIHEAAQAYAEEFPEKFDDPETTWDDYAGKVLEYAAATNPMPPSNQTWVLAKKVFQNSGWVIPDAVGTL